jgi:DNA topoisomerase-3
LHEKEKYILKTLIITEKPSVAQAIAAVVGAITRKDGYFEGNGYIVGWCLGHLAQLVSAEAYDPRLSRWRVSDLPILPHDWRYRVPQDKRKQLGNLRWLMLSDDVSQVINACDAGREGELIFRNLYELTGCTKPTLRLWLNSMEEAEIRRALGDLRPGSDYDRLFAAARCRERADWLVGINATRLLSVTYHRTLNTGRDVRLALLTQREADIAGFVPEAFYNAELHLGDFSAESKRFSDRGEAEAAVVSAGGKCVVSAVSTKEKSESAPALYDLTTLQREANRVLGYTAQQTLDYAQSLYEKRLCTYPRTDSRFLTDGMEEGVKPLVLCAAGLCGLEPPFAVYAEQVCDSSKVSDHHALVPTMSAADCELDALPAGERELLRLMAAQVLRAVCAPHRWLETSVELACGGVTYSVMGKTILEPGWRVYDSAECRDSSLPELHEGDELPVLSAEVKEGQTSPPAHFTEGTLLKAMENAGDTPDEAERKGLGTPATRAGIIEELVAVGFIERKKAKKNTALIPTQTGAALTAVLPEQLASAELTSEWERKLSQVERGELAPEVFMSGIEDMVRELCGNYTQKLASPQFPTNGEVIGKCPRCGCNVVKGKHGYFCESSVCRFALWTDNKFLAAKRIRLSKSQAAQLLRDGRTHINEVYSAKRDAYYPADLILKDDGERVIYWLDFGRAR